MKIKRYFSKLKNTLMFAFLLLSIVPLILLSLFFLYSQSQDLSEQSTAHLITVRDTQQQQVINYFQAKESEIRSFARSELGIATGGKFYGLVAAFEHLGKSSEEAQENAQNRYIKGSGDILSNDIPVDSPNYAESERYRLIHKRYHHRYLDILLHSDFSDILLVNIDGTIVYSTNKDDNYGTNLVSGKYQNSELANTFRNISRMVNDNPTQKISPVAFSDFHNEQGELVAWFASPIKEEGYLHSFIIFKLNNQHLTSLINKFSINGMNTLLTNKQSTTRINIKDSEQNIQSESIQQAIHGFTSVDSFINNQGNAALTAYTPITVLGKVWALSIELPEEIAYTRIYQLEKIFFITLLIAIIIVIIASHYLSNSITAPILNLAWIAEHIAAGDLTKLVLGTDRDDEIGRLAMSFARMKNSINDKLLLINRQNDKLENNLTLIQQQNSDLQQTDKLKDAFLATTSHELRTPLHGMLGISETLMSGAYGHLTIAQQHQLSIIINSGQRLSHLVDDLLDYHKMRYGNLYLNKNAVDISAAIHLVLELSNHLLEDKPLRIINQTPEKLPLVVADEQRLEQVLYNLIGNAIKYTNEGKIVISCKEMDGRIQVQVVDTGQGLEIAQLESLFEPLSQPSEGVSHSQQGAGLGLSISRQLIELMGGTLLVSSQPQLGTTFSFSLPLATEIEKQGHHFNLPTPHFTAPDALKHIVFTADLLPENPDASLLIVADDDAINLQVLVSFLRLDGYRVKTARNGQETLDLIAQEKPALLLLDVMMPGMSGYQVSQTLRKQYSLSQLPIIMLTALSQSQDRVRGFEAGASDYVNKPFNQHELSARINAHIQASQSLQLAQKNTLLTHNLQQQQSIEVSLLETQQQLFSLLENSPDGILCVSKDQQVHFANHSVAKILKRTPTQLKHSHIDDIIVKRSQNNPSNKQHDIDVYIEGKVERLTASTINLPIQSGLQGLFIFFIEDNYSAQRVIKLENAVDALSKFAFDGDRETLQQLKELGGEFTRLVDTAEGKGSDKKQLRREVLVELMVVTLKYWERESGQNKFQLAEDSQLWRVYLDRSTLQTRTLDKYMHLETLPKTPRWKTVLSTIEYVLTHCQIETKERNKIENLRAQLQKLLA